MGAKDVVTYIYVTASFGLKVRTETAGGNRIGIPVAAGVLYPAFGFMLSPVVAGAAMALSSITVVSNANRLRLFTSSVEKQTHHK